MYVVGGHGYVGSRVVAFARAQGVEPTVVSRHGGDRFGMRSLAWPAFLAEVEENSRSDSSIVWLLDGAKHNEPDRLIELLRVADEHFHVAAASTCTLYGDRQGSMCDETTPIEIVTDNARLKASCEAALHEATVPSSILRLGALYGVDDRGVRRDRIEKWVAEAATRGTVTVPEPSHWRGWLHRDQAARALYRAAERRITGVYNVATSNHRFRDAAGFAANIFGAAVRGDGRSDPMNYTIDSTRARDSGMLDEVQGEDVRTAIQNFATVRDHSTIERT